MSERELLSPVTWNQTFMNLISFIYNTCSVSLLELENDKADNGE